MTQAGKMTDLELTEACAEAMRIAHEINTDSHGQEFVEIIQACNPGNGGEYEPLHDDAQAMALVNKFRLHIGCTSDGLWFATEQGTETAQTHDGGNLNRAICECVAKIGRAG